MRIAIGADAAGFGLKADLVSYLERAGYEVQDVGTYATDPVHYPDYAEKVARSVAEQSSDFGILICGTGIGMSIAANKVGGVRAALVHDTFGARMSREHNDANVLAFGAWEVTPQRAKEIVSAWLIAGYKGGRHDARLHRIRMLEQRYEAGHDKDIDATEREGAAC